MSKFWDGLKKAGEVIAAAVIAVIGIIFVLRKKTNDIPTQPIADPEPTKKVTAGDIVKEYEAEKEQTNAEIDSKSRDDLIADVNAKFGPSNGSTQATAGEASADSKQSKT